MKKKFDKRMIINALYDETDNNSSLKLHKESEWIDEGKYQHQEVILVDQSGIFWQYINSKSGSYFSEYMYGYEHEPNEIELTQVHEVEVLKKEWVKTTTILDY